MALTCSTCGEKITTKDQVAKDAPIRCHCCIGKADKEPDAGIPAKSPIAPKGLACHHEGTDLIITRRRFDEFTIKSLLFSLCWNGMFVGCYMLFFDRQHSSFSDQLIAAGPFILGILLFLIISIWTTYAAVCGLVNRTTIRVDNSVLSVRNSPLPWISTMCIPTASIDQIFCEEIVGGNSVIYHLGARLRNGKRVRLLYRLLHMNQVAFIEQQVSQRLGITDRPVEKEMAKFNGGPTQRSVPRTNIVRPTGITVLQDSGELVITWKWFNPLNYTGFFIGTGCAVVGTAILFTRPTFGAESLVMLASMLVIAIPCLYFSVRGLLNRTVIHINSELLTVRHVPLPAVGSRCIAVNTINQLYCIDDRNTVGNDNYHTPTYSVWMVMVDGERELLLTGLKKPEQAEFVELEIEHHLGIADRSVIGEMIPE